MGIEPAELDFWSEKIPVVPFYHWIPETRIRNQESAQIPGFWNPMVKWCNWDFLWSGDLSDSLIPDAWGITSSVTFCRYSLIIDFCICFSNRLKCHLFLLQWTLITWRYSSCMSTLRFVRRLRWWKNLESYVLCAVLTNSPNSCPPERLQSREKGRNGWGVLVYF